MICKWIRVPIVGPEMELPPVPKYADHFQKQSGIEFGNYAILHCDCEEELMEEILQQPDVKVLTKQQVLRYFKLAQNIDLTIEELDRSYHQQDSI